MVIVAFPLRLHVGGQLLNEAVNIRDVFATMSSDELKKAIKEILLR